MRTPASVAAFLSALLLHAVASGKDGDAAQQPREGPSASKWDKAAVGEWLFEEGFGVYRDEFAAHDINGHALLSMREHYLEEHFKIQRSACSVSTLLAVLSSSARRMLTPSLQLNGS